MCLMIKNLLPERFATLLSHDLTHLLSDHVLIPHLSSFDACMGECEALQRDIHQHSLSLKAAYKNPRIALLHKICRDIIQNSKKNNSIMKCVNLESTVVYANTTLTVIPLLMKGGGSKHAGKGAGVLFTSKCMDTDHGIRSIPRFVYNMYDVLDSCRMHEYRYGAHGVNSACMMQGVV